MNKKNLIPKSKAKTAYGLLSEVRALILAEPKRYDQTWWLAIENGENYREPEFGYPACGTVGCVAGWVTTLKQQRRSIWSGVDLAAQHILGLSESAALELFESDAAKGESQTMEHAKSGAKHIARFQKKYAAQLKAKRV